MPRDDGQWRRAPAEIDAPLVTFSSLTRRTAEEWTDLGWRVVLDPFSAQVLAHLTVERFYRAALAGQPFDVSPSAIMEGYGTLPAAAGLEELYDIERATTEPGT
jgi:methylisocitrate lyase